MSDLNFTSKNDISSVCVANSQINANVDFRRENYFRI